MLPARGIHVVAHYMLHWPSVSTRNGEHVLDNMTALCAQGLSLGSKPRALHLNTHQRHACCIAGERSIHGVAHVSLTRDARMRVPCADTSNQMSRVR